MTLSIRDFAEHLDRLRSLPDHPDAALRSVFEKCVPIRVARAPGRLDVMGGIGDYSGSLVLEMPIAEAAFAAVQRSSMAGIVIVSLNQAPREGARSATISAEQLSRFLTSEYGAINRELQREPAAAWAAYILGPVLTLLRETRSKLTGGLRILIDSNVPEGKGVSSSAAIEVATMRAVAALLEVELTGDELARLCQLAENRVVGAPCGIMDQMTSALGQENELLALRCQPATVEGFAQIPPVVAFWGVDSGIRHAVSGADYSSVRVGAFMGYRMIAEASGMRVKRAEDAEHKVEVDDPTWHGYLANITPAEFRDRFDAILPNYLTGREFLSRYVGTTDSVTRVDPARTYAVRSPTLHPIEENARSHQFRSLLEGPISNQVLAEMGQIMAASHASYSACGLASDGTDLLVRLVQDAGPASGLYGAKITGGGSGGTVAILGRAGADSAVDRIAQQYAEQIGRQTYVFRGSSPGAYRTPIMEVII
jgi:galactokinase